jgi:hypothetical protein
MAMMNVVWKQALIPPGFVLFVGLRLWEGESRLEGKAADLKIAETTVRREWNIAKTWL